MKLFKNGSIFIYRLTIEISTQLTLNNCFMVEKK